MRRKKSVRWHIDRLTVAGGVPGAWAFAGGCECDLAALLAHLPVPVPGFGASDCRRCPAHLFSLPAGAALPPDWAAAEDARSPAAGCTDGILFCGAAC
jgi:histidyl-tRNA synthetase